MSGAGMMVTNSELHNSQLPSTIHKTRNGCRGLAALLINHKIGSFTKPAACGMLLMGYEHKCHSIRRDGLGFGAVSGRLGGRRVELEAADADPKRRQQFKPEIRQLARSLGLRWRGVDLHDLSGVRQRCVRTRSSAVIFFPVPAKSVCRLPGQSRHLKFPANILSPLHAFQPLMRRYDDNHHDARRSKE